MSRIGAQLKQEALASLGDKVENMGENEIFRRREDAISDAVSMIADQAKADMMAKLAELRAQFHQQ